MKRLDSFSSVQPGRFFADNQQIMKLAIDEIAVATKVHLIDVNARRASEQSLEAGHRHDRRR